MGLPWRVSAVRFVLFRWSDLLLSVVLHTASTVSGMVWQLPYLNLSANTPSIHYILVHVNFEPISFIAR